MTGTPAERAALLSARIHREINHEGNTMNRADFHGLILTDHEDRIFWYAFGYEFDFNVGHYNSYPFARLGAELRAIVLGNREGRR